MDLSAGERVMLTCPGKVNLALSVAAPTSEQADPARAGWHRIASWMAAVSFGDQLTLERGEEGQTTFDVAFEPDESGDAKHMVDWPIEKDLAFRAHQLLEQTLGRSLPTRVTLRKRIPPGAGLAGGSSNAAGVLAGLDRLFELRLNREGLLPLAAKLGSDVSFLLAAMHGQTAAVVTHYGEQLAPAPLPSVLHLVLILPGFASDTRAVYQAFDQQLEATGAAADDADPDEARVWRLASQAPVPQDGPFNDLAEPACAVTPALKQALQQARDAMQLPVHITGSGSTLYLIAPTAQTAQVLARKATALTGLPAIATRTL